MAVTRSNSVSQSVQSPRRLRSGNTRAQDRVFKPSLRRRTLHPYAMSRRNNGPDKHRAATRLTPRFSVCDQEQEQEREDNSIRNFDGDAPALMVLSGCGESGIQTEGPGDCSAEMVSGAPAAEDVGLPADKIWDQEAFESRIGVWGGPEYLLHTPDRWMSVDDFKISGNQAGLEDLLIAHLNKPANFDPRQPASQAKYWSSLYSQIHSVLSKYEVDGKVLYLVRWKPCWTPERFLEDINWVEASLEKNKDPTRRRAPCRRAASFSVKKQNYEKMMWYVHLDRE